MKKEKTLLEILIRDLPGMGGWPDGIGFIAQDSKGSCPEGKVFGYKTAPSNAGDYWFSQDSASGYGKLMFKTLIAEDSKTECISREQYESALAASNKPSWNGEGLPPVGCDVEYDSYPDGWVVINIVARIDGATFIEWKSGCHKGADIIRGDFPISRVRPLSTEADNKREAGVMAPSRIDKGVMPFRYGDKLSNGELVGSFWYELYDAIAAGKIPGVKLED